MSITRWDPIADAIGLRQVMDSLLEQSFVRPRADGGTGTAPFGIAVDVEDRGDAFVVEASIPGSAPEDVEISVMGDVLRLRAERREERQEGDPQGRVLVREQRYGVFERALRLPATVDASAAQAEFRDGVLRIILPKALESQEQRIPVRAASGQSGQIESGQSGQRNQSGRAATGASQDAGQGGQASRGDSKQTG
jgi:HSP20 family protein